METQVLGLSVDSVPCLTAWAESLGGITYPLLSDFYPHGEVATRFGILREEGITERAIFIMDKQGVIQYVDVHDIDDQPSNAEIFAVLDKLEPALAAKQHQLDPAAEAVADRPDADVIMYCTTWCPACRRARRFFQENGIDFLEIDIGKDRAGAQRVREWANGNLTTPTFDVKGEVIVDYKLPSQAKLRAAVGIE
jgi:glutaredoxin